MLKKLFRQEWIAITKVLLPVNLLLIAITLLGSFALKFFPADSKSLLTQTVSMTTLMLYFFALVAVTCAAYIFVIVRFYKTMYSDEGYLTHTLPVSVHTLIVGKGLAAAIWLCITYVMLFVSILFLVFTQANPSELRIIYQEFLKGIDEFNQISTTPFSFFVWMIPIMLILSAVYSFLNLSASLAIGQLFTKHKIIGSILAFCGIYAIVQVFSFIQLTFTGYFNLLFYDGSFSSATETINYIRLTLATSIGFSFLLCVIFYLVTWKLTDKKLNLD
ncbi:MAG: hypothetical protein QM697_11485 [Lachnospiraceae bacterium]